ncbi:MAG: hypothetical protein FWC57_05280 [Endomicrobia bacterium]|nr:hypothetical protein [Endomicrobiia bacterium]
MKNKGKTTVPKGAFPEKHELKTAWFLNDFGKDVEFLVPADKQHIKTPDIKMDGIYWEIKSPTGNSSRTIENTIREALTQSKSIILDLRRIKLDGNKAILQIKRNFELSRKIYRIIVICKDNSIVDIKR